MTLKTSKLLDVCDIYQPKTISKKNLKDGGKYLVYGANGVIGRYDKFNHEQPQLLLTCRGATCGSINISEPFSWINGNAMVIRPKNSDLLLKFVEYFFRGIIDLRDIISGAAQPQITRESLAKINIKYPNTAKQKEIINKLDKILLKVKEINSLIKINLNNYNFLLEKIILELCNQKHYPPYRLGEICEIIGGSQPPKSKFQKEKTKNNVRLIQIRDYKSDDHIVYIDKRYTKKFCNEDDVMIGRYGPPLFQILRGIKGAYNVALMKAVPKLDKIKNDYLFYFLQNKNIQDYIISLSNRAAGQTGVNKETLLSYPVFLPPLVKQEEILRKINKIKDKIKFLKDLSRKNMQNIKILNNLIIKKYLN